MPRAREVEVDGRAAAADREGVRPALLPRVEPAPGVLARPADGARLGLRGRARHRHRHRAHPAAAREDRARPAEPAPPRDGLGRRLPVRAVIGFALAVAARDARRRPRRDARAAAAADRPAPARRARAARRRAAARRGARLGLGDVPHGRRREDPRRRGGGRLGGGRRGARARHARSRAAIDRLAIGVGAARRRRPRARARRRTGRASSPTSAARSTRWPRTSRASSTPAASSSPRRATTCARRSPRSRRCSRRSRTASPSPTSTSSPLQDQARRLAALVDDLFELARIDAGALALELADGRARAARRVVPPRLRGRGARAERARSSSALEPALAAARCAPGTGRARPAQPAHERAPPHAVRRHRRRPRSRRPTTTSGSPSRTPARASRPRPRSACSTASGAATRRARRRRRRRARPRDRTRARRGPGRTDLGRAARDGRRPGLLHAPRCPVGVLLSVFARRRGSGCLTVRVCSRCR